MTTFTESYQAARGRPRVNSVSVLLVVWTAIVKIVGWTCGKSVGTWTRVRTTVMQYAAFGVLTTAVWMGVGRVWGLVAVGISLLLAEMLGGKS